MAAYQSFTTARTTPINAPGLLTTLRATVAPETGITTIDLPRVVLKKAAAWTPAEIAAAQNAIDTGPALTPQSVAQNEIDNWPLSQKAFALALIDQLNVIRSKLSPPLGAITPQQALDAIRTKAGTL